MRVRRGPIDIARTTWYSTGMIPAKLLELLRQDQKWRKLWRIPFNRVPKVQGLLAGRISQAKGQGWQWGNTIMRGCIHTFIDRQPVDLLPGLGGFVFKRKRANRLKGDIYYGRGCNQFSRQ